MRPDTLEPDLDPKRPAAVRWEDYTSWLLDRWKLLLDTNPGEPTVQRFLEAHPCLLPGATDNVGPGGHHGVAWDAVYSQPELKGLGRDRWPDFLWIRRDTAAVRPILIEIEAPGKPWFTKNRKPHASLGQALDQLVEWKVWFEEPENQLIFKRRYVPNEFGHRRLVPQFVLIYGRDHEFREGPGHIASSLMRRKREHMTRQSEHFFTYDMLRPEREAANYGTIVDRAAGVALLALPPTYTAGPETRTLAGLVPNPVRAIQKMELVSNARRSYLRRRWAHWHEMIATKRTIVSGAWGE
jgi:hypothetical protein